MITAIRNNIDNKSINKTIINQKKKWGKKAQLHEYFKRQTSEISHEKTWTWLRKGNFEKETESLLKAAQNNAIMTNSVKERIDQTQQCNRCWLCSDRDETINYIISECSKLEQKEYKTTHNCYKKTGTATGGLENNSIAKIGQNTKKSPGDLRKLALTQTPVVNYQLTLVWNKKNIRYTNIIWLTTWRQTYINIYIYIYVTNKSLN